MKKENHEIYFNTRDELTKVHLDDVVYIVSDGNYITIKFKSGRNQTLLASLQNFLQITETLHDERFVRIGRSHIVNIQYVSQVNNLRRSITLVDDQMKMTVELLVSKEALRQLKQMFAELPRREITDFKTTNGNMKAFQLGES